MKSLFNSKNYTFYSPLLRSIYLESGAQPFTFPPFSKDASHPNNNNNINLILPKINNSLLNFNLKGLNLYNKSLKSYISKYNFTNLILNIRQKSLGNKDLITNKYPNLISIENKSSINSNTIIPNNNPNNKIYDSFKLHKYLEKLNINNKTYINNNSINYVKYIDYKNISINNLFLSLRSTYLYDLLFNSFLSMNTLISKPVFEIKNEKVIIHLFIYLLLNKNKRVNINNSFTTLNKLKLDILCQILSHIFKKPVQLELVRIYYPYFDSNIFVNLLSNIINIIQVRVIMKRFFKKAIIKNPIKIAKNNFIIKIPSLLSGINIRIGGRLLTQRIIPRKTVKTIRKGTLSKGKINFLDEARYTNKNKRGAFTLVVSIGHYLTK